MNNTFCGIDFGTSNTSCAIIKESQKPILVNVEGKDYSSPSTIFFANSGSVSFGKEAIANYMSGNDGRFMRSLKRVLGTELMTSSTIVNSKPIKFDAIIARYLKNTKDKIDTQADTNVESVIMGRPVYFRDNDKKGNQRAQEELENIAKAVGFKNVLFQFEPIAAAFAHEQKIEGEKLACVIDIGGGTSDFSIIKVGNKLGNKIDRSNDILANTGVRIGGNDFDKDLSISSFMPSFGMGTSFGGRGRNSQELPIPTQQYFDLSEWSSINMLYNYATKNFVKKVLVQANEVDKYEKLLEIIENEQGHALLNAVENTKIKLTNNNDVITKLDFLYDKPEIVASKTQFEKAIKKDVNTVLKSVNECLKLAGTKAEDIDIIILTGGSTEIPYVKECLCQSFNSATISSENKFSSVGLGLAYDAPRRFL